MTPELYGTVVILVVLVMLSAFFSASETAFTSANCVKLKTMAQGGNKRAQIALNLAEDYDRLLSTILVGNNVVNIGASSMATGLFLALLSGNQSAATTVSTIVMTIVVLIFGEISPKAIAKENPETVAVTFAPVLLVLRTIVTPINALFVQWKKLLAKLFKPAHTESFVEAEIMTMVDEAQNDGDIDEHEGELIRSVIEFNDDRDVLNIMTPRVDVTALEDTATMEEAANLLRETGYTRVPVYHEDMDHIVGILNEKDFYACQHEGVDSIVDIMKPPVYAPATLKLSKLLKLFQTQKTHMLIVLDEFGGTEGIVTMEDVLEELVGEIYDEHDDVSEESVEMADGSRVVEGGMELTELLEDMGLKDTFNAETVGGWVSEIMGCIPFVGARFETDHLRGMVTRMEKRRVTQVRIWRKEGTDGHAAQA